jgi:hypothetical protein
MTRRPGLARARCALSAEWIVILPGPLARMPNGSMEATMGEMDHRRALLRDELGR